ncbi:trypsin domain-containing protein [Ditylenchus destructor]|nr:trypsin domain-containing protein [Ditylenchus destructor]
MSITVYSLLLTFALLYGYIVANDIDDKYMVYARVGDPTHLSRLSVQENDKLQSLCGRSPRNDGSPVDRIEGGDYAKRGHFPWVVSMAFKSGKNKCTGESLCQECKHLFVKYIPLGTLISNRHMVTAVHCFYSFHGAPPCKGHLDASTMDKKKVMVHFGGICIRQDSADGCEEQDTKTVGIKRVVIDKEFVASQCMDGNDLAVVELDANLNFTAAKPICLRRMPESYLNMPRSLTEVKDLFDSSRGLSEAMTNPREIYDLGWGRDASGHSSAKLRVVSARAFGVINKRNFLRSTASYYEYSKTRRGICEGDSGGPTQASDKNNRAFLIGVHSKGPDCNQTKLKTKSLYTSVYIPNLLDDICALTGVCAPEWK